MYEPSQGKCRFPDGSRDYDDYYNGCDYCDPYACARECENDNSCTAFHLYTDGYSEGEGSCWLWTAPNYIGNGDYEATCYVKKSSMGGGSGGKENYDSQYPYMGCYNHDSSNSNTPSNFPDSEEAYTMNLSDCAEKCSGYKYFGLTDSDCVGTGGVADCHCGDEIPYESRDEDACLV